MKTSNFDKLYRQQVHVSNGKTGINLRTMVVAYGLSEHANEAEANARLISAAPELLETLRAAGDFAESMLRIFAHPNFTDRHNDADRCRRMLEWIDAAIAKAEPAESPLPRDSEAK